MNNNNKFGKYEEGQVTVCFSKMNVASGKPEHVVELNWPALGNVSIEQAEKFLENLEQAIDHAKTL